ncbi:MAG TPA: CDP-alcohol phosphatidyltransferase family protein [Lacipirellulaceae bacterium]|nr:CDP-alcohol phosphatidyltransferase family protein [Lacipirellulaceae bacterium]
MSKRVSYSWADPWLTLPLKGLYPRLGIPAWLPPEAIVACGHVAALGGAVGLALATRWWWAGWIAAAGVALNHVCDVLDGTHARATGQCRNGGELLDHFVDPLSFSYWSAGMAAAATADERLAPWAPWLGLAGVVVIYAMAVLTNIRAKMVGEFTLARFGPTEFKSLLVLLGVALAVVMGGGDARWAPVVAGGVLSALVVTGAGQLVAGLVRSVGEVNALGAAAADTTEWVLRAEAPASGGRGAPASVDR